MAPERSRLFGETSNALLLTRIKPRSLSHTVRFLLTIQTEVVPYVLLNMQHKLYWSVCNFLSFCFDVYIRQMLCLPKFAFSIFFVQISYCHRAHTFQAALFILISLSRIERKRSMKVRKEFKKSLKERKKERKTCEKKGKVKNKFGRRRKTTSLVIPRCYLNSFLFEICEIWITIRLLSNTLFQVP